MMRLPTKTLLPLVALFAIGWCQNANGQVSLESYNSLVQRMDQFEAERYSEMPTQNVMTRQVQPSGWFVNYENVVLMPMWSSNTAGVTQDTQLPANIPESSFSNEFQSKLTYSPRIEIGYAPQNDGWGFRARYWQFEHDTNTVIRGDVEVNFADDPDIAIDDNGMGIGATQQMKLHTWDLEATSRADICSLTLIGGGGIRVVDIEHMGRWTDFVADGERATLRNKFSGAGPTIFLEAARPLDACGRWKLFSKARGSVLAGNQDFKIFADSDASTARIDDFLRVSNENSFLPIAELQLGTSYARETPWGLLSLSLAWEAQVWFNSGVAAANEGAGKDSDDFQAQRTADMLLHGFNFGIGLSR
jgi:hypothetical protein